MQVLAITAVTVFLMIVIDRAVQLLAPRVSRRADALKTRENVLKLRRAETYMQLGIAVLKTAVVIGAVVWIWQLTHPTTSPWTLVGIGTIGIVVGSATIGPILRDITYGVAMILERWYNVGDHVVIEPFTNNNGGIVERVTLRATKLRSVTGEAIWFNHQWIQGARVTSAASHVLAVETFVNDPQAGQKIIEDAVKILPSGATTMPQSLGISEVKQVDDNIWRVTAICEVTPFREWMFDTFVSDVIKKTDQLTGKASVIVHGPIAYYADITAERRFQRSAGVRKRFKNPASDYFAKGSASQPTNEKI